MKLNPHFLHTQPDLFNWDIENPGDVFWRRRDYVSRLTFYTDTILDVFFKSPSELKNVDCVGVLAVRS